MIVENKKGIIHTVILTYNRLELLKKCLEAVFNQTLRPEQIITI